MNLQDRTRAWIAHDPDPATRDALTALLDEDSPELAEAMNGPLRFGTAGLRGVVGPGESRMNVATVTRATAGLAAWLTERVPEPIVVVGCDARHGSKDFYDAACEVLSAAGCRVLALPPAHPTPLTSFAVRHYNADAGVMVTASHNPAPDNGYKVYLGGRVVGSDDARGVQLIAPADAEISAAIDAAGYADEIARNRANIDEVDPREAYYERAVSLIDTAKRDIPVVFTAMHGVGGEMLGEALRRAGFTHVTPVAEQQQPDADFPTVAFPNPEEDGALDLAIATADQAGASVILALDPDADRCSVAIKQAGEWTQLSGDQVGGLLGEDAARRVDTGTLACSVVSSQLLRAIAQRHGLHFAQTLTGFKWIGRQEGLVYGYEEALGYCSDPAAVRDKDGITACLRVAELAARVGLPELLDEIGHTYGYHVTVPLTLRKQDISQAVEALERFVAEPPTTLGGSEVVEFSDLGQGYEGLPPTPGRVLRTADGARVLIRPSGTEPKLKCYLEVIGTTYDAARERVEALKEELAGYFG
ncbi:phospho-sugar mutase [Corynebacterium uterequi]|uniref:Phosphomannomutase n=1 Tax=Corynebacterium uterequi TaxID=1072256 RepID=A0A0G3HHG9_9CORY|nr:phospho-sugar mutase [Corynebacterium uterequi]AKK11378.1 phosphomannomutase [Corynebacterium uterequi]